MPPIDKRDYQRYYVKIYKASDSQKTAYSKLLFECLKLNFENAAIEHNILKAMGKSEVIPQDKPVFTAEIKDYAGATLPRIKLDERLEQLIPFYKRVAEDFYRTYKSSVDWDAVRGFVAQYQPFTLEQLQGERDRLIKQKRELIYMESCAETLNAVKLVKEMFASRNTYEMRKNLESIKNAYREGMRMLYREGFGFYEADRAVAAHLFLQDIGLPSGYILCEGLSERYIAENDMWTEPFLSDWYKKEREEVAEKRALWKEEYDREQEKKAKRNRWQREVTEYLTHFIENGGRNSELAIQMQEAGYTMEEREFVRVTYEELRKTVKQKRVKVRVKK